MTPGRDTPADDRGADAGRPSDRDPSTGGRSADWFGNFEQLDFEIDFFEKLLARNSGAIEVLRVLAELVSQKGLVKRALELDRRLVARLPNDFLARYNLACSLARAGRPDEAIDALSRAILLGYDDLAHLEVDPDLDSLREHPDFKELLGRDSP
jgi:tetratricopeptide (TPR) repeat protein